MLYMYAYRLHTARTATLPRQSNQQVKQLLYLDISVPPQQPWWIAHSIKVRVSILVLPELILMLPDSQKALHHRGAHTCAHLLLQSCIVTQ